MLSKRHFFILIILPALLLSIPCFSYGIEIKDVWGNVIKLKPGGFKRIISLYGAHTENLFYLKAAKKVIGVSIHDDYPPEVRSKPKFSYHDGPEKFIAYKPDLILIRPMIFRGYKKLFLKLREVGITVISLQPTTARQMFEYWKILGILTDRTEEAEKMVTEFLCEVKKVKEVIDTIPYSKRKKVYLEAIHKKFRTFAPDSISMFVLETAGGINIAEDAIRVRHTNIAYYSKEKILSHADKIDVYISQKGPMNNITIEDILKEPGFKAIKAIREGKVFLINEEILSRPTPRIILGIRKIAKWLYPEKFH